MYKEWYEKSFLFLIKWFLKYIIIIIIIIKNFSVCLLYITINKLQLIRFRHLFIYCLNVSIFLFCLQCCFTVDHVVQVTVFSFSQKCTQNTWKNAHDTRQNVQQTGDVLALEINRIIIGVAIDKQAILTYIRYWQTFGNSEISLILLCTDDRLIELEKKLSNLGEHVLKFYSLFNHFSGPGQLLFSNFRKLCTW